MESSDNDSQNSLLRCSDPGTDSSDSEVEELCDDLDISVKEAQANFSAVGNLVPEVSSPFSHRVSVIIPRGLHT